ncbi:MAG: hypothetical protein JO360_02800, partial [Acidobacteria bacterium]|nr:hypothetical protein [Acidobacteriota bacterium]
MSFIFLSRRLETAALVCLALAVALSAAGCGRSESKANVRAEGKGGGASAEAQPVAVTTAQAVAREVPSYIQATGSLVAEESSDVAPQTSGQVVATPVGVGAFVRQG